MTVASTSRQAYTEIKEHGVLSARQAQVLAAVRHGRDYSLQELVKLTGLPINCVSGRCFELRGLGKLELGETRKCSLTNKSIHPVKLPAVEPAQQQLELV